MEKLLQCPKCKGHRTKRHNYYESEQLYLDIQCLDCNYLLFDKILMHKELLNEVQFPK